MNKADTWSRVIEKYPEAIFEYWFHTGELIFYKNKTAEDNLTPTSCYMKDGKLTFTDDF